MHGFYEERGVLTSCVVKNNEYFPAKFIFEDDYAKKFGNLMLKSPTFVAFALSTSKIVDDGTRSKIIGWELRLFFCAWK